MGLNNIGDRLACLDLLYPRLSSYDGSYQGMIGFPFITHLGELGAIRVLAKGDRLFNT